MNKHIPHPLYQMQLRNGKYTSDIEQMLNNRKNTKKNAKTIPTNCSIQEFEKIFISRGHQTLKNMRDLQKVYDKTDDQYRAMLQGFARIYNCQ